MDNEKKFGKEEYLYELNENAKYIFNIWPLVQNYDVNEYSFASNDVYNKGAMMLHCLRSNIHNDTLFFNMIKDFAVKYQYQTINTEDFILYVNDYTNENYRPFLNKFLYDTEPPLLLYSFSEENGDLKIKYKWTGVEEGFVMPFGIETNNKESLRLIGSTELNEIIIPSTRWFNFYNRWKGFEGVVEHAFTYFNTKPEDL